MQTAAPPSSHTCENCRHHRTERHPKVLDTAFDTVVAFADEDVLVFFCTSSTSPHAGTKIGTQPISCDAWESPRPLNTELDLLMARAAARAGKKEDR